MYTSPTSPNFSNASRRSSSRSSYDTLSIFTDTKFEMSGLFPRGRASSPSSPSRVARAPSRAVRRLSPSPAFASPVASPVAFASSAPSFARASSSSPFDIAQPRVAVSRVANRTAPHPSIVRVIANYRIPSSCAHLAHRAIVRPFASRGATRATRRARASATSASTTTRRRATRERDADERRDARRRATTRGDASGDATTTRRRD